MTKGGAPVNTVTTEGITVTTEGVTVTTGQELILRGDTPLAQPSEVVVQATAQANALMDIVHRRNLFIRIGDRDFLQAEAWQVVSSFNETAWVTEWVRPVEIKGEIVAYEAKVNLVNRHGIVVGAAIMSCGLDDDVCKARDGWDRHKTAQSAAETWAGAKASRMKFAWVAVLAGFAPTPAEEMIHQKETERAEQKAAKATLPPCPQCGNKLAHRVGKSKITGRDYDFWGCTNRECKFTAQTWPPPQPQEKPAAQVVEGIAAQDSGDFLDEPAVPAAMPKSIAAATFEKVSRACDAKILDLSKVKSRMKVASLADLSEDQGLRLLDAVAREQQRRAALPDKGG